MAGSTACPLFAGDVSDASIASAVDIRRAPGRRADTAHSVSSVHLLENAYCPYSVLCAPLGGATPSTLLAILLEFYLQNDPSPYERVSISSPV